MAASLFATFVAPAVALEEDLARQVLAEINLARTEPLTYAGFLREFQTRFQENSYLIPGSDTAVQTSEGVAAVEEAIDFLTKRKPLPPLAWSAGLAAAAAEQVLEQGKSGATGHKTEGKVGIRGRVKRHGITEKKIGETSHMVKPPPLGAWSSISLSTMVCRTGDTGRISSIPISRRPGSPVALIPATRPCA